MLDHVVVFGEAHLRQPDPTPRLATLADWFPIRRPEHRATFTNGLRGAAGMMGGNAWARRGMLQGVGGPGVEPMPALSNDMADPG